MSKQVLALTLLVLAFLAVYYSSQESKTDSFEEWKSRFGVTWTPQEEAYRRIIFEKNVIAINKHNSDPTQTYKMGINQFTIYTEEEFTLKFLANIPMNEAPQTDFTYEIPNAIDWTTQGKVTAVKNQGQCGSCWAFSATGVLESWSKITRGQDVNLSEQQLVDCTRQSPYNNYGCNGGWPSVAIKYVADKGLSSETEYPYTARDGSCLRNWGNFKISGQSSFTGCSGLSSGINTEPISVTVDAGTWGGYRGGVLNNCGNSINHAVLLVGVDDAGNWKIKNSWGTTWGESGYIRLAPGNTCGLCLYAGVVPQ